VGLFGQITLGHQLDALSQLRRYDDIRQLLRKCASQRIRTGRPGISRAAVVRFQYSLQVQKFDGSFCKVPSRPTRVAGSDVAAPAVRGVRLCVQQSPLTGTGGVRMHGRGSRIW
jgi:hypothetical protein